MAMTVAELIEMLECCDPQAEVRIASQPRSPLQFQVAGCVDTDEARHFGADDSELEERVVWIVRSDTHPASTPYPPAAVFAACSNL